MKRTFVTIVVALIAIVATAQQEKKFSPEKFEADMAAFITKEAQLTSDEAAKFLPLLREMHGKQRELLNKQRAASKQKPADDKAAAKAIEEQDRASIELKQIEQQYHKKMLKVLPATKAYRAIQAESRFHRRMLKVLQRPSAKGQQRRPHPKGKAEYAKHGQKQPKAERKGKQQ